MKINTIDMLNAIRNEASTEYQERIPEATRENLQQLGQALSTYTPMLNEFTNALVTKIGLQIFNQKMAVNKLASFKRGMLSNANDIEEIFVEMAKSTGVFDKEGSNVFGRRANDIKTLYHRQNYQNTYEITVSDAQVKNAFQSESGVQSLATAIINSMYSGCNYDEYLNMKSLLASYQDDYKVYEVPHMTDEETAKTFLKTVRKATLDLSFMSTEHNAEGVKTYSEMSDLVLLIHKDIMPTISVDVLASLFNVSKAELETAIVVVDDFGSMEDTYALLVDKSFFMMYDTLHQVESIRNPQGLYTNYFLHIWQIHSLSRFKNAIAFKTPQALATSKATSKVKK